MKMSKYSIQSVLYELEHQWFYSLMSQFWYIIHLDPGTIVANLNMKSVDLDEFSRLWKPLLAATFPFLDIHIQSSLSEVI